MISRTRGKDAPYAIIRQTMSPPSETVLDGVGSEDTVAAGEVSNREAEISRLTWVVLDGNASVADRQRLAELVSAQHESRSA